MSHKGYCDNCGKETKVVRLSLGGGAGAFLCRGCWAKEMAYRKRRNKTLSKSGKFSIRKYPG